MKNLILETKNCVGYGYMCYIENDLSTEIYNFLNNFCIWGGSTKNFKNYIMFELSEDVKNFMLTDTFKYFIVKNNVNFILSDTEEYNNIIHSVFEESK